MRKLMSLLVVVVLLLSVSIPVLAEDQDIVEIAVANEDFSILVSALQKAGLVEALQGEGPFTVFAPTNAAFQKLLTDLDITAQELLDHPQLAEVLKYHVVSGSVLSTALTNGMTPATLNGETIKVDLASGVKINESTVTTADVLASNGVIHIIDTVLVPTSFRLEPLPKTVVDIALSSDDFSILVSALQKADLVGALQAEGPFTVFAPTNAAFEKLLKELDITASDLLNQPDLAKVLLHHVVPAKVMSTDLTNGLEAETLNKEKIKFDLSSGVKVSGSTVTTADIEADNGVVHVIDTVLIPQNFTYQKTEEDNSMPKTGAIGLTPFVVAGIMTLAGAGILKKKIK